MGIEEKELQAVAKEDTKDAGASKTMRYSDRRKEERARREKEKLEKLKKKEGGVSTDVLEEKELDKVTDGIQKIDIDEKETNNSGKSDKEVIDLTTSDSKRKEERMGQRSGGRRGQSDIHPVQDRREDIEDGNKQKDERGQLSVTVTKDGRKVRNKERPAIQIYRPGMGKYSSKTIKKEEESPGPSPEESRESSPTKTKGSRSGSNEDQRREPEKDKRPAKRDDKSEKEGRKESGRRNRRVKKYDEYYEEGEEGTKKYSTKEYYSTRGGKKDRGDEQQYYEERGYKRGGGGRYKGSSRDDGYYYSGAKGNKEDAYFDNKGKKDGKRKSESEGKS